MLFCQILLIYLLSKTSERTVKKFGYKLKAQTERYLIWFLSGDENVSSMTLTMYVKQFLSQVDKFNPISTWTQISPQALWGLDDELCDWNYLMKQAAVLMFMTANCKLMVQQIKHDSLL